MTNDAFEAYVEEGIRAIPERFRSALRNVAFLVAEEPTVSERVDAGLDSDETLFGLYQGIPLPERGESYGIGMTLPDRITIFRAPILEEAGGDEDMVRTLVRDTVWHEVAHYFGYDDDAIFAREVAGTNFTPTIDAQENLT